MNKIAKAIDMIATLPKSRVRLKYPKDSKLSTNQKRTIRRVFNKCGFDVVHSLITSDVFAIGGRFWEKA
jgi:hypothetical protein